MGVGKNSGSLVSCLQLRGRDALATASEAPALHQRRWMPAVLQFIGLLVMCAGASAQAPTCPAVLEHRDADVRHAFWDRENLLLFGGVGVMRTLDYTSTLNMLRRGREEILLPGDVVRNHAGFAALEVASAATSIGISYALHRTGHHKLERWLSIGHISVAGFGAAWNYALDTHP